MSGHENASLSIDYLLMTDHKALVGGNVWRKKKCSAQIEQWVLRLLGYNFQVKHVTGSINIANFLSRLVKANS